MRKRGGKRGGIKRAGKGEEVRAFMEGSERQNEEDIRAGMGAEGEMEGRK